ncbi:MAG: CBU_0592 family membrane protein [Methylococcaceae bacterium]
MIINDKYFELTGWIGFILIISAYLFLTIKLLDATATAYHLMNLSGALCMVVNAWHKSARPLLWLNIVWSLVAIIGLIQIK